MNKFERLTLYACAISFFVLWLGFAFGISKENNIGALVEFEKQAYEFISEHTIYDTSDMPPVRYEFRSQERLNLMYYNTADVDNFNVEALYVAGVIYLKDDFDLKLMSHILVHELVHHVQFVRLAQHECPAEVEREAYTVMDKWVERTGVGRKTDPLFMLLLNCRMEMDYR